MSILSGVVVCAGRAACVFGGARLGRSARWGVRWSKLGKLGKLDKVRARWGQSETT